MHEVVHFLHRTHCFMGFRTSCRSTVYVHRSSLRCRYRYRCLWANKWQNDSNEIYSIVRCFSSLSLRTYFYWLLIFMQRTAPNSLFSVSRMIFCMHLHFPIVLTIHKLVSFSSKHLFFLPHSPRFCMSLSEP